VVVKPVDSSGSDGVRVCRCDQDIEQAVASVLNVVNAEGSMNTMVVVEELLQGVEFVVNTVSLNGHHCITDVWTGPPKCQPDGVGVIFDRQDLAAPNQDLVEYSFAVLDALHLRHGAAHLEIMVTERGPVLIECNARASGDLPRCRASLGRDQLEVLAMSLADPAAFFVVAAGAPSVHHANGRYFSPKRLRWYSSRQFLGKIVGVEDVSGVWQTFAQFSPAHREAGNAVPRRSSGADGLFVHVPWRCVVGMRRCWSARGGRATHSRLGGH